jgi:ubiquinone/menaquinone biosynthesis C-methylase UbiE
MKPVNLNLGCGFNKKDGFVNVDAYDICRPDVVHDLNVFPYPWEDASVDHIDIWHVLEHLDDWWGAFLECTRILKPGGTLDIRVPDESSSTALTYRDHHHVFHLVSFHGTQQSTHGTSAWAKKVQDSVPMVLSAYHRVPWPEYHWMFRWPFQWLGNFCALHGRNFIWEQRFLFNKR